MQSALGWTLLSREALRRAETHLRDGEKGVRDEIGFLTIHQAYADRFFPGTSVLQTRLRYVLFVPWLYSFFAQGMRHGSIDKTIREQEITLAKRLKAKHGLFDGVIGGRSLPKPTSQPPTIVYWNALVRWGILRPRLDGTYPSRAVIHRVLHKQSPSTILIDDDRQPLEEELTFFVRMPDPPKEWHDTKTPLSFVIRSEEADFIQQHLVGVQRAGASGKASLLACLVEYDLDVDGLETPWQRKILKIVDQDEREALLRAQQVASLAAIGRGVYAALVERLCEINDKRNVANIHRAHLQEVIKIHGYEALKLGVMAISKDDPGFHPQILDILSYTQQWLKGGKDYLELLKLYEKIEVSRKGKRARLANNLAGQEKRAEWSPEEHPKAYPLSYRWNNVKRLLKDLRTAHG